VDELDALTTDELRHRAFELAEHKHDVRFFWDLVKHLRVSRDLATEDTSSGSLTGSIADAVSAVREMTTGGFDESEEPLLRARFIDYIRTGD
jgi:hypothetical protein